jgi:hypothetical protein
MVTPYLHFNLMPSDGRRLARDLPNPVATIPWEANEEPAMFDLNRLLNARLLNVMSIHSGATADLQRMLDWKLLRGSHEFPGPDGGTCINEAAIVAAGHAYRPVYCVKDMPASFSRPIAMLALCLNDTLEDELRQELLVPFVARLGGTADAPAIEMLRAELMLKRTVSEIMAPALARAGFGQLAERCRQLGSPVQLVEIARCLRNSDGAARHASLVSAAEHAADAGRQWLSGLPTEVVFCTFSAMRELASIDNDRFVEPVYRRATAILDASLEIGNQTEDCAAEVVATRLDAAKRSPEAALAA